MKEDEFLAGFSRRQAAAARSQKIPANLADLTYGVSITDACIDWPTTDDALLRMRDALKKILPTR